MWRENLGTEEAKSPERSTFSREPAEEPVHAFVAMRRSGRKRPASSVEEDQELTYIRLSHEKLNEVQLEEAVRALTRDGACVLQNAVRADHLRLLDAQLTAELDQPSAEGPLVKDILSFSYSHKHLVQSAPRAPKWVFADLVANPAVEQVALAYVGSCCNDERKYIVSERTYLGLYSCNSNMPGNREEQPVHSDIGNSKQQKDCRSLIANVCTCDVDERNGAIELMLGTQEMCVSSDSIDAWGDRSVAPASRGIPQKFLDDRAKACQAVGKPARVRVATQLGDVLLRDRRLWHRGMQNPSGSPRHMLSMTYFPDVEGETDMDLKTKTYKTDRVPFEDGCQAAFSASLLKRKVTFDRPPGSAAETNPRLGGN